MDELTVVEPLPQKPVVSSNTGNGAFPIYSWKTGKSFILSKTRKILCDTYFETRSIKECQKVVFEGVRRKLSESTIRRVLELPECRGYLSERMEDSGYFNSWTKEHWFAVMSRHLRASADYEYAKDQVRMYEAALDRRKDDTEAVVGLTNAREGMRVASGNRLAPSDLYAMKLIGQFKGWEVVESRGPMTQINITQKNGVE